MKKGENHIGRHRIRASEWGRPMTNDDLDSYFSYLSSQSGSSQMCSTAVNRERERKRGKYWTRYVCAKRRKELKGWGGNRIALTLRIILREADGVSRLRV